MNINKLSWVGMICGTIFASVSFIQYYVLYRDMDRVIAYPAIGILIALVSYLYDKQVKTHHTLTFLEDKLQDYFEGKDLSGIESEGGKS